MTIVERYLLREYMRAAVACIAASLLLFLMIDLVERADEFIRHRAAVSEIVRYYAFRLPGIFIQISPVAVLLAVLIAVSLRSRTNELTAMFSAGVSLVRISAPVLAGCALVSVLSFGTSEYLAPAANRQAKEIARLRVKPGKLAAQFSANRYWIRGGSAVLSAQVIDPAARSLSGFEYLEVDGDFRLVRRIDARKAVYAGDGRWHLEDGRERRFPEDPRPDAFARREVVIPETIQRFLEGAAPPEEMTYGRLAGYIRDSRAKGYDVSRYEVDLHAKLSYPLLNVIVGLLGIPFALRSPRQGGVWRSIGGGLLIGFLCWVALSSSLSLGRRGLLPPLAAAWLPDVLFAGVGALLFRRIRR